MMRLRTDYQIVTLIVSLGLTACKTRTSPSELHEFWYQLLDDKYKAVQEVSDRNEYIRTFANLPREGSIKPLPWASNTFPDSQGGLSQRPGDRPYAEVNAATLKDLSKLSPIEKFDLLLGHQQWELTLAERTRTRVIDPANPADKKRSLDQDWAAASLLFAEPKAIQLDAPEGRKVPFASADIKALLMRFTHQHSRMDDGVETRSLGGICHLDSDTLRRTLESRTLTAESWNDLRRDSCFNVDAGAFHLALSNLIGLRQESFVIDPMRDDTFQYFPVLSFKSEPAGEAITTNEQHQLQSLKTTVRYVQPGDGSLKASAIAELNYLYTIETDENGDIIAGRWDSESVPSSIWMQNRPKFTTDDSALERLYTTSVSLPGRMAVREFSSIDTDEPDIAVKDNEPLVSNRKYRIELSGDVPRGADGLRNFLKSAFRPIGPVSIYRNTFADEDALVSVEVQVHGKASFTALRQAVKAHSNGRAEISRILR